MGEVLGTGDIGGHRPGEAWARHLEANTKLRHSAFSQAEWAVVPFEVREEMEGDHTPEKDLTRRRQVLEGEKFESSFFRSDRCCFLALS